MSLKQLHIVESIAVEYGGIGFAALRFSEALAETGEEISLYVVERSSNELSLKLNSKLQSNVHSGTGSFLLSRIISLVKYLVQNEFKIIHVHGTWSPILAVACLYAIVRKIPLAISPHGCLESVALKNRGFKKKLALLLYQKFIYLHSTVLFATSNKELSSIRELGVTTPVAIIPIGVEIPSHDHKPRHDIRKFVFLSRIHPIKGLFNFVSAWHKVRRAGWRIVIAGPDENGHLNEIVLLIKSLGIDRDFDFMGSVSGEKKRALFNDADVFVLPSLSENFGIVVAEALSHGIPVITTTSTPWEDLHFYSCGWWVNPDSNSIASSLDAAMNCSSSDLVEMGLRGIELVKNKYSWNKISNEALGVYCWMVNTSQKTPDCVHGCRN